MKKFAHLLLMVVSALSLSADEKVFDIFKDGKLVSGAELVNAQIIDGKIETELLASKGWGNPKFEIKGLHIDLSSVPDIALVKVRMIALGQVKERPSYSEIIVGNSAGQRLVIPQFPFRAYRADAPDYMTKSLEFTESYASMREGKSYGSITSLALNTGNKVKMKFSCIQILIDADGKSRYPDDPAPSPEWRTGKLSAIYALPCSERVFRDELDSPHKKGNSVWKNGKIVISGAKRESVSFQIVLEAEKGKDGLNGLDLKFDGLRKEAGLMPWEWLSGDSIDNYDCVNPSDPYDYVGRSIQLYRARYLKVSKPCDFTDKKVAQAAGAIGREIPEILIPFEAKWGAAPFSIFPGTTQSLWVDIYIPVEASDGMYHGQIKLLENGNQIAVLPVELEVLPFSLPEKISFVPFVLCEPGKRQSFSPEDKYKIDQIYRRFFRRHGMFMVESVKSEAKDFDKIVSCGAGSVFTRENGYEGRSYGSDDPFLFINFYNANRAPFGGPKPDGDEKSWHEGLSKWKKAKDKLVPSSKLVFYAWDEPSHNFEGGLDGFVKWTNTVFPFIKSFEKSQDEKVLTYSTTWRDAASKIPALDAFGVKTVQEAEETLREKRQIWLYNGPMTYPNYPAAMRICGWKAFHLGCSVWWLWHVNDYSPAHDVYSDPYNFHNQYGEFGAGDGLLVYPGNDKIIAKRSPGLDGPVPCQRFFNWRQGLIDYEYLKLASEIDPKAAAKIASEITDAASLACGLPGEGGSAGYPKNDSSYSEARKKLVDIIVSSH